MEEEIRRKDVLPVSMVTGNEKEADNAVSRGLPNWIEGATGC